MAKPAPKKGKTITTETLHLVINLCEDGNFSRYMPEKKDYISVSKGVHNQNLCYLQELYTAFKVKHPNGNIVFSKFSALRPKCFGWLKNDCLHLFVELIKMLCC